MALGVALEAKVRASRSFPASKRTPRISAWSNTADQIESHLQEDGHRIWGFVIYRSTYASDDDWAEFLQRLHLRMQKTFQRCCGLDILDRFSLTVLEDPVLFDGATTSSVREHFLQWVASNAWTEQRPPDIPIGDKETTLIKPGLSQRYRFAIQVDAAALHSVVHDAPDPRTHIDTTNKGWVKLIDKTWTPDSSMGEQPDETFEPIEGSVKNDVGWMKVPYRSVMTEWYVACRSRNIWPTRYCRPPDMWGSHLPHHG